MFKIFRKNEGFTMIELIVAVAIVAILVGIAIPSYTRFQQRAKFAEANTNMGAIKTAEEGYKAENDAYRDCLLSPRASTALNATAFAWADLGTAGTNAFADVGYAPQGSVRFNYEVTGSTANAFTATANCDLDDDNVLRVYTLTQTGGKPAASGDDL